jgi:hypothetical protein
MAKSTGKSRKREVAISALLTSRRIADAAHVAGISERCLLRWLKEPEFAAALADAKGRLLEAATTELRAKAAGAVDTLATIAGDKDSPSGSRVMAGYKILELALKAHELETIEARLQRLEAQANVD